MLGALATPVLACDLCSIYTPAYPPGDAGRGFFAGAAEQFTRLGTLQENGEEQANDAGQFINGSMTQMFAGYRFNDQFGVQFNLPLIHREFRRPRGTVIENGTESGLGDVALVGNCLIYQKLEGDLTVNWNVLGGFKLPTGDSSRLAEPEVENEPPLPESGIAGHDLALGSGSYDGLVGTMISTRWKRLLFEGNVQYAIRTEGDFGHQYANDLTWAAGPGVSFGLGKDCSLALFAMASGETKENDTFDGVEDPDSAVTIVYFGPEIRLAWSDHLSALVGADFPLSVDNTGLQVVADYRIRAAVSWHF